MCVLPRASSPAATPARRAPHPPHAPRIARLRHRKVVPKQFIRPVNQVDLHGNLRPHLTRQAESEATEELFVPDRLHRIKSRRAARRQPAREHPDVTSTATIATTPAFVTDTPEPQSGNHLHTGMPRQPARSPTPIARAAPQHQQQMFLTSPPAPSARRSPVYAARRLRNTA